ncbi:vacuolar protein sorting-associated protein 33B-like [Dysidea avara]|uniref:vacuolar protein sorting-associated protein 33B-like n=1 Tax=Dysidea avara TaxID=196820 RepID=UPI00331DE677
MAVEGEAEDDLLQDLRSVATYEFEDLLSKVNGTKDLVIQPELMPLLEHVTPYKFLKSRQVDRMFRLDSPTDEGNHNRFFLIKPELQLVKQVLFFIEEDRRSSIARNNVVIFVPRMLYTCESLMEQNGMCGLVKVCEWHLDLLPLDNDFMSLEVNSAFRSLYIDQDLCCLHTVAISILNFQRTFGVIPTVHAVGPLASTVYRLMNNLKEVGEPIPQQDPRVQELILFDRKTDLVTPLCSQLTYEGILDDVFGIKCGFVEFDTAVTDRTKAVKVLVNSTDPVFKIIRSKHFSSVNVILGQIARELDVEFKEGRDRGQSVAQMKEFVKRMPELKTKHNSLEVHVKACERIVDKKLADEFQRQLQTERALIENYDGKEVTEYLDECIHRQMSATFLFRLISLMSCTFGGLKSKVYQHYKQLIIQASGHKHLTSFYNLRKCGLLQESSSASKSGNFKSFSKRFNLVPKSVVDVDQPTDTSFVFGGVYKPLSCSVIGSLVKKKDWSLLEGIEGTTYTQPTSVRPLSGPSKVKKKVLVYFIGGCSLSEVNALRFIGKQLDVSFIVATTNIVNGKSLIDSVIV